jgi:glycosyltransferase involved in cell wall biosynthesis
MPSLYEGFGLPCLEAMAAGTPVVASDRAALPEACGGAALLADPDDSDGFAAALVRAAGTERERLVAAGRERAATLSWDRTAHEVDAALEPLLGATGRRP